MSSREAVNMNFEVIGLTRLEIKPKCRATETDALTTWPSELSRPLKCNSSLNCKSKTAMIEPQFFRAVTKSMSFLVSKIPIAAF